MKYIKLIKKANYYYLMAISNYREDARKAPTYYEDVSVSDPQLEEEAKYSYSRGLQPQDVINITNIEWSGDTEFYVSFDYKDPEYVDFSKERIKVKCESAYVKSIDPADNKDTSVAKANIANIIANSILAKAASISNEDLSNEDLWYLDWIVIPNPKEDIDAYNKTLIAYQSYILAEYSDAIDSLLFKAYALN